MLDDLKTNGIIYRITNKIDNKSYIGKAKNSFYKRYVNGSWWEYSHNEELKSDYRRLGKNVFTVEILYKGLSNEDLSRLEPILILSNNCLSPSGYNKILFARDTTFTSDETRKKMSVSQKAVPYSRTLKRLERMKGFRHTEESKIKIGHSSRLRGNPHNKRGVIQIHPMTKVIVAQFDSICTATKETNAKVGSINDCIRGRQKLAVGFKWEYANKEHPKRKPSIRKTNRTILQLDPISSEIIAEFPSVTEAASAMKLKSKGNISCACRGRYSTIRGYKWAYKDTYEIA